MWPNWPRSSTSKYWFLMRDQKALAAAINDLKAIHPNAPARPPEGARDLHSTYLHLLVCMLEFDGLQGLVGADEARKTLLAYTHYPWVYREVLERPALLRDVLRRHRLDAPDARR